MLLVYPKAEKDNIPGHILKQIRKELDRSSSKRRANLFKRDNHLE